MISRLGLLLPVIWQLGLGAVLGVSVYRLACRFGVYRKRLPIERWSAGSYFFLPSTMTPPEISQETRKILLDQAEHLLSGELVYFSNEYKKIGNPPDWFQDPFGGSQFSSNGHWSNLDEFSTVDIKNVWEASRFEWAPLLARAWRLTSDERYLETLNNWLFDWVSRNPANGGPNWKCGQEASIRLINLLLAARLLGNHGNPSQSLVKLAVIHCVRIYTTISYAVAQNNNHGTSEAAALFIGGAWLMTHAESPLQHDALRWRDEGRRLLENRVAMLVSADGSFSQYSVNYHRVLIDTLSQVELWRKDLAEPPFSETFTARCRAAVEWLAALTDYVSGNTPNLGANDGARLYDLSLTSYRDFRSTVQLASVLFLGGRIYGHGNWDEPLLWLDLESLANLIPRDTKSIVHGDGGFGVLRGKHSWGLIRFAKFRFRPSHADCLHLDLWFRGKNVLRDGGTFSYNTEPRWLDYFSGTESHNTIQFDDRNQMPRIGRFLFGTWLEMDESSGIMQDEECISWTGSYSDSERSWHRRTVSVNGNVWRVCDEIDGFQDKAVLRWRLIPEQWSLFSNTCESALARLSIHSSAPIRRLELTTGWESLYYQYKSELPVLEIELGPGRWAIETEITLKD